MSRQPTEENRKEQCCDKRHRVATQYCKNKAKECCDKLPEDTTDLTSRDRLLRSRPEQRAGPLKLGKFTWSLGVRPNSWRCINRRTFYRKMDLFPKPINLGKKKTQLYNFRVDFSFLFFSFLDLNQ